MRSDIRALLNIPFLAAYPDERLNPGNICSEPGSLQITGIAILVELIFLLIKRLGSDPVYLVNFFMKTIITDFVFYIQNDEHGACKSQAQSGDVDKRINLVPRQVA